MTFRQRGRLVKTLVWGQILIQILGSVVCIFVVSSVPSYAFRRGLSLNFPVGLYPLQACKWKSSISPLLSRCNFRLKVRDLGFFLQVTKEYHCIFEKCLQIWYISDKNACNIWNSLRMPVLLPICQCYKLYKCFFERDLLKSQKDKMFSISAQNFQARGQALPIGWALVVVTQSLCVCGHFWFSYMGNWTASNFHQKDFQAIQENFENFGSVTGIEPWGGGFFWSNFHFLTWFSPPPHRLVRVTKLANWTGQMNRGQSSELVGDRALFRR